MSKFTRIPIILAAMLASLALCANAEADVMIGQVAPPNPEAFCNLGPNDIVQVSTGAVNAYAVPQAGVLTSWSTSAAPGAGQSMALKVYRPVSALSYTVVGRDGPRNLEPGILNTFPINIPVQAGDVIGLNDHEAPTAHDACFFVTSSSGDVAAGLLGNAEVGSQLTYEAKNTEAERRVNVAATLQVAPTIVPVVPIALSPAAPQCIVPRLGAKKLGAARKALKKAGCRLGRATKLKGATAKSGLVVSQSPQTGKKLAEGSKVSVKLAPVSGGAK